MSASGNNQDQLDRHTRCRSCKRPFEPIASRFASDKTMACPFCGHENRVMRLPTSLDADDVTSMMESSPDQLLPLATTEHHVPAGDDPGDDLTLAPIEGDRPKIDALPGPELRFDSAEIQQPHSEPYQPRGYRVPETARRESDHGMAPPRPTQNPTTELPPQRIYPTLDSLGRLYKLFGYVGVLGIFGYLLYQFIAMVWRSPEGEFLNRLVEFTEFALPFVFGTAIGAGALFAASEGIQLVIDIQENTLHSAHQAGKHSSATHAIHDDEPIAASHTSAHDRMTNRD